MNEVICMALSMVGFLAMGAVVYGIYLVAPKIVNNIRCFIRWHSKDKW